MIRDEATQNLIDLEASLHLEVLTVLQPTRSRLSMGDALAAAANSQGDSHHGETIELNIERLGSLVFAQTSALHSMIVGLGHAVAELAEYVASSLLARRSPH